TVARNPSASATRSPNPTVCSVVSPLTNRTRVARLRRSRTPEADSWTFLSPATAGATSRRSRIAGIGRDVRPNHLRRVDDTVELRLAYEPQLERRLLERQIIVQGVVGDLRGLVVPDNRRKCGDEHQRAVDGFLDLLQIGRGALDQELGEI